MKSISGMLNKFNLGRNHWVIVRYVTFQLYRFVPVHRVVGSCNVCWDLLEILVLKVDPVFLAVLREALPLLHEPRYADRAHNKQSKFL